MQQPYSEQAHSAISSGQSVISGLTEMFRDPDCFQVIRKEVLPYLETWAQLNIWHAGCSTGEEAYSMAILLKSASLLKKASIYATDKYKHRILQGKAGRYQHKKYEKFASNYRNSGLKGNLQEFMERKAGYIQVCPELISCINFFQHDLISGGPLNSFACIFCRNVMFYYPPEIREKILRKLLANLAPHGFIILGNIEDLRFSPQKEQLRILHKGFPIYQKISN